MKQFSTWEWCVNLLFRLCRPKKSANVANNKIEKKCEKGAATDLMFLYLSEKATVCLDLCRGHSRCTHFKWRRRTCFLLSVSLQRGADHDLDVEIENDEESSLKMLKIVRVPQLLRVTFYQVSMIKKAGFTSGPKWVDKQDLICFHSLHWKGTWVQPTG